MPILITGATGTNGRDIIKELAALKAPVRALVRDAAKAADLQKLGVELAVGSFDDAASLRAAAGGCDRALMLAPSQPDTGDLLRRFMGAAKEAGVRHLVHFSAISANPKSVSSLLRAHGEVEVDLKRSGLAWTILKPGFFMQNLLTSAPTIKGQGTYYNMFGESPVASIDTRDTAAVAARVLTGPGHEGQSYTITGSEALTCTQVAAVLSRVLGREVRYVNTPREEYFKSLLSHGLPESQARGIVDLDAIVLDGTAAKPTDIVNRITGREPRTNEQFIRDHAAAFKA